MPELKRTIIAQGESVNLSPAIVSSCAEDLVAYCAGFESNKDDYGCLQVGFITIRFPRVGFTRLFSCGDVELYLYNLKVLNY